MTETYYETALNALMLAMIRVIGKIASPGAQISGVKQVREGIASAMGDIRIDTSMH